MIHTPTAQTRRSSFSFSLSPNDGTPLSTPSFTWGILNDIKEAGQLPTLFLLADVFKQTGDTYRQTKIPSDRDGDEMCSLLNWVADRFFSIAENSPRYQKIPFAWSVNISKILHACIQFTHSRTVDRLLIAIADVVMRYGQQIDPQGIGNSLHGLKNLTANAGTEAVLRMFSQQISSPLSVQMNGMEIGFALNGLQNLSPSEGTEELLMAVASHIRSAQCEQFSSHAIGCTLYGLKNLTISEGTEAVLLAIADHIGDAQCEQLCPQSIGNALYGLKNLSPSEGTEAVLLTIAGHIGGAQCEQLSPQAIGNALYGLKNLSPSEGTEAVLLAIADHIGNEQCEQLSHQEIGNALYGLKNLSPSEGTEAVLMAIASHISNEQCGQLTAQEIGNALFGLQNLTSSTGTEAVLRPIAGHIASKRCEQLSPQAIANALYGIKYFENSPYARDLVSGLADQIANCDLSVLPKHWMPETYSAEVLDGLTPYLLSSNESVREVALDAVFALTRNLKLPNSPIKPYNVRALCDPEVLEEVLMRLLANKHHEGRFDFHGCSYRLAETFGTIAVRRFLASASPTPIVLIFGLSSHILAHHMRMQRVAHRIVEMHHHELYGIWEHAYVVLHKT